jgi:hypothetical protein
MTITFKAHEAAKKQGKHIPGFVRSARIKMSPAHALARCATTMAAAQFEGLQMAAADSSLQLSLLPSGAPLSPAMAHGCPTRSPILPPSRIRSLEATHPTGALVMAKCAISRGLAMHVRFSTRQVDVQCAMSLEAAPSQLPPRSQLPRVAVSPMRRVRGAVPFGRRGAWRAAVVGAMAWATAGASAVKRQCVNVGKVV